MKKLSTINNSCVKDKHKSWLTLKHYNFFSFNDDVYNF